MSPEFENIDLAKDKIEELGKISISTLLGGKPLPRLDLEPDIPADNGAYTSLAREDLTIFQVTKALGQIEYIIGGPVLVGRDINRLLYFAAPSKVFGIDVEDTIMDWTDLYEDKSQVNRLNAHRRIPNWQYFEDNRVILLETIKKGRKRKDPDPLNFVIPIVRIRNINGELSWNLDSIDEELAVLLKSKYKVPPSSDRMIPAIGPLLIAAFSPDITTKWPTRLGYSKDNKKTQDMGPTQTLPLTLANSKDLLGSILLKQIIAYATSGQIPYILQQDTYPKTPQNEEKTLPVNEIEEPKSILDLLLEIEEKQKEEEKIYFPLNDYYKNKPIKSKAEILSVLDSLTPKVQEEKVNSKIKPKKKPKNIFG